MTTSARKFNYNIKARLVTVSSSRSRLMMRLPHLPIDSNNLNAMSTVLKSKREVLNVWPFKAVKSILILIFSN